ncbi:non-hydrolyzing UDP-N-acetylglucosamine 2-epimerase [Natrinema sp. LN54]|uniref:non-hydrolyzing UDP-N-acetylglucosamine 2-epimerase n=1 Tax=Natrinema sp. LN54 TaxID=3458705 RepID=UPI004035D6F0
MAAPRIAFVLGTRPEIIKLSPLIRACDDRDVPYVVVHTGQHYSDSLDTVFFEQLELPTPTHNLEVGSDDHGAQTAEMIRGIESILTETRPDHVIVHGDTNSALAGAIATSKLEPSLAHVEAGLRSFDRSMPEEINRVLADHVSNYRFAPTDESARLLAAEGIDDERVVVTGNTIVDAVSQHRDLAARKSTVLEDRDLESGEFYLLTAHRAENVDDPDRFGGILAGVGEFADRTDREVVYPIHPRARENLEELDRSVPDPIRLVPPLDFLDFLTLEDHARLAITDSGGVQEEACILGTPCLTVRDNTERPETIDIGANRLVGTDRTAIVEGAEAMVDRDGEWPNPFGDGTAADRILDALL